MSKSHAEFVGGTVYCPKLGSRLTTSMTLAQLRQGYICPSCGQRITKPNSTA